MTLVDTSVWISHFRQDNFLLREMLEEGTVATHPMIIGELACGNLARRTETLGLLARLPSVTQVPDALVFNAIESRRLWGKGIGWVDAHLLVASLVSGTPLWTLDARLLKLV